MLKHHPLPVLLLVALVTGFSACGDDDDRPDNPVIGTITDIIQDDPQFSTLAAAIARTEVVDRLDVPTIAFTVFAPTNDAFTAAGIDLASVSDQELTNILNYHIIRGSYLRSANGDFAEGRSQVNSNNGTALGTRDPAVFLPLTFDNSGGTIRIDEVANASTGIEAVNGIIYPIDMVLTPPDAAAAAALDGRFTILLDALARTGLDQVLADSGTYTIFAPTDDAFAASGIDLSLLSTENLRDILAYHVLPVAFTAADIPGGMSFQTTLSEDGPDDSLLSLMLTKDGDSISINSSANVVAPSVLSTNAIIHGIDEVLEMQDLVDFVVMAGMLDSLQAALTTVGLVDDLMGEGPFTVFAPNNAAFTAAADTIATLTTEQLTDVLRYHVILDNLRSTDLEAGDLTTINGQTVNVNITDDNPPVLITQDSTQVNFVTLDVQATNGVIHIIDGLLLPNLE